MNWVARNGLTLEELEQLEQAAHQSQTAEAKSVFATRSSFEGSAPAERVRFVHSVEG